MIDLLSAPSTIMAPVIIVKIGDVTFGLYNKTTSHVEIFGRYYRLIKVDYPNYMRSLSVRKINGLLNVYTLTMEYAITANDDPNLIDKVLSKVSRTRKIVLTYGDATVPGYMFRNEEALITKVTSLPDVASAKIVYVIQATSTALGLNGNTFDFDRLTDKLPSEAIRDLLKDKRYGLLKIFYGMYNLTKVQKLIDSGDRPVEIQALTNVTVLERLRYLVDCMSSTEDDPTSIKKKYRYILTFHDSTAEYEGPYFTVRRMVANAPSKTSLETYTVDIGYPTRDLVLSFSVTDDLAYSILYDYSQEITTTDSVYRIEDDGTILSINSPSWAKQDLLLKATEPMRTWWSNVTQYPIKATLTIRGLLRAIVLMSYIRVGVYYYGKKHNTSGLYIVNQQDDYIDTNGYRTTLSLIRILGDELD